MVSRRSLRGLDWLNFFVANAQTGFGPFIAVYLTTEAWGTGAGYALHESALATLATNYDEAVLWVLDSNARAREFYERHHWSADGATKQETRGDAVLNEVRYRRFTAATGRGQL